MKKIKLIQGVGINDADYPVCPKVNGKGVWCPAYRAWHSMIVRCYSEKSLERHPTYRGCSVHDEWHSFMNFKKWFDKNYIEGWCLDKDLAENGNKQYGPSTCIFLPQWLNNFTTKRSNTGRLPVGVSFCRNRFQATVSLDGKKIHIGMYDTPEDAHKGWRKAKLDQVQTLKGDLDKIDNRLYKTLLSMYKVD